MKNQKTNKNLYTVYGLNNCSNLLLGKHRYEINKIYCLKDSKVISDASFSATLKKYKSNQRLEPEAVNPKNNTITNKNTHII